MVQMLFSFFAPLCISRFPSQFSLSLPLSTIFSSCYSSFRRVHRHICILFRFVPVLNLVLNFLLFGRIFALPVVFVLDLMPACIGFLLIEFPKHSYCITRIRKRFAHSIQFHSAHTRRKFSFVIKIFMHFILFYFIC